MLPDSTVVNCCTGFYKSEDNCLECDSGFTGSNCSSTCPFGYFGRQCRESCDCSPDKYCDAARGCLCNSTIVNCADLGDITEATLKDYTNDVPLMSETRTEYLEETIVAVCIFVFAVIIIGTVCIRIWYAKTLKNREDEILTLHNVADADFRTQRSTSVELDNCNTESSDIYNRLTLRVKHQNPSVSHTENLTTSGSPSYCAGPTSDEPSHHRKKNSNINKISPITVCKKKNEELQTHVVDIGKPRGQNTEQKSYIYSTSSKHARKKTRSSELKQQRAGRKTFKPTLTEPVHDIVLDQQNSRVKPPARSGGIHEEELYANNCDMEFSNRCLRRDNSIDEDSNEYFDVRYDGKMTMYFDQINNSDRPEPSSSETFPDLTDYINCGLTKGYNVQ